MRKVALGGTLTVVLATLVRILHGDSHTGHQVPLAAWQWAYVVVVVLLAPVVAVVLLWTRQRRAGAWLLLASMSGSLVFGLVFHYLVPGPDNVLAPTPGAGGEAFRFSAALVALVDALGCVVGIWAVGKLPRPTGGVAGTVAPLRRTGTEVRR